MSRLNRGRRAAVSTLYRVDLSLNFGFVKRELLGNDPSLECAELSALWPRGFSSGERAVGPVDQSGARSPQSTELDMDNGHTF